MLRYHRLGIMLIVMAAWWCVGCSDNGVKHPDDLAAGWNAFEEGEYDAAISSFHTVVASDSNSTEGYTGLGWAYALSGQLDSANEYFAAAIDIDTKTASAFAGQCAIYLAYGAYDDAIANAEAALAVDPEWSFAHDPNINYYDLHLILAQAYYARGANGYANALAEVKIMNQGTTLSPDDPDTWNGHPTYAAALLKEIEMLEGIIGADLRLGSR